MLVFVVLEVYRGAAGNGRPNPSIEGKTMTLAFEAKFVDCRDAIGGEILQVSFDTVPASHDEDERCTPYALISRNFEFFLVLQRSSGTTDSIMMAVLRSDPWFCREIEFP